MRVMTLFGTRPEIIRLSEVIRILDRLCDQVLVYTGQNYDPALSDVFFEELEVRKPDSHLGVQAATFAEQVSQILARSAEAMERARPDRLLILGDTNSGLAAIVAARRGIAVYHMEAGNRCFDDRVPEEINRRLIDHCSSVLMPYTHRSKENLLREGIPRQRIFVTGNPIFEVLKRREQAIAAREILEELGLEAGRFFLATLHRAENVDDPSRLALFLKGLQVVAARHSKPVVVSLHPRTEDKIRKYGLEVDAVYVRLLKPLGFLDFVKLEQNAACVLSDSGTVQEECSIFRVPNVTLRDVTERAETIECGSNILSGADPEDLNRAVTVALTCSTDWTPPAEYLEPHVARTATKVILGYHQAP